MVLITGGAGFIGSNLVHYWIETTTDIVINVDELTYAGNLQNLAELTGNTRYAFFRSDIGNVQAISQILRKYRPRAIINLAAESHFDRSIHDPSTFIQTNVVGTLRLLKAVYSHWSALTGTEQDEFRFLHVSTDEVYGSLEADAPPFTETTAYAPNSPYAASKAASDHLVRSYHRTYGLPALTTNCSDNYGPYQFPEKLVPLFIHRALAGKPLPIYGDGQKIRDWLYVADHCAALRCVLERGRPGEKYNIGASNEMTNLEVAHRLCDLLDEGKPRRDGRSYREQVTFVKGRPGHDRRYGIDAGKIERELAWKPKETFDSGLRKTIRWYLENQQWVADVTSDARRESIVLQRGRRASSQIDELWGALAVREDELAALNRQLREREVHIASLDQSLHERTSEIGALREALAAREAEVLALNATISALYTSTSWRVTAPLRSLRRLIARLQCGAVGLRPLLGSTMSTTSFFRGWPSGRLKIRQLIRRIVFWDYLSIGTQYTLRRFIHRLAFAFLFPSEAAGIAPKETVTPSLANLDENTEILKAKYREGFSSELSSFLSSGSYIILPISDQPKVSIIIVLFNQAELTLECLRALENAIDVPAEVIIVDNASTDLTGELCARTIGTRVIKNHQNVHLLRAVNQAAVVTRGDAILLLNNDTRVKAGSISAAYQLLKQEANVGAVGGKVVLLDGALQEAGSIIWSDGSCLGYGRGRQPSDSEFQFRRDVDYCSGAFLLVRRSLFEYLGWFDTAFAPAYYEETDLCMRIREAGFRVVYEPRVELSHFEFGSSQSSKAAIGLQVHNRTLFLERHRTTLQKFHHNPEVAPLYARMNSGNVGRILMIDDRLPDPTLGSGFPRARSILQAIHEAGWFVTFYPLNFPSVEWEEAYRRLPRDVEIMADQGALGLEAFLRSRAGYYDAVMVSRPHNMAQFKQAVASNPAFFKSTTLIYDAEAIFSARNALWRRLSGAPLSASRQQTRLAEEIALAADARIVFAVTEAEAQVFRELDKADVRVLGHSLTVEPTSTPFSNRSNILFVGALDDDESPNVDSLVWFVRRVMPLLDRLLGSTYCLTVAGRNGSRIVRELGSTRVHFLGRVEDLHEFYSASRIFIAPTRYAAGIPMKVHESASAGLPAVATSLLADQLRWKDGRELLVADDPEDFARACFRLYSDEKVWSTLRANASERIKNDCSPSKFSARVASALAEIKPRERQGVRA
jgi:dTDP-glucose 4,6-dehydratase